MIDHMALVFDQVGRWEVRSGHRVCGRFEPRGCEGRLKISSETETQRTLIDVPYGHSASRSGGLQYYKT